MRTTRFACLACLAQGALACDGGTSVNAPDMSRPLSLRVPELGPVPPLPVLPDDPPSDLKTALGTAMAFDVRLSGSGHTRVQTGYIPDRTVRTHR